MWDSGVRKALKIAAQNAGCDFEGFGLHSFRRANITWRQEVGGSAIEASKIAGHASVSMTGDYTIVQLQRQEELTRAIQERVATAREKQQSKDAKAHAQLVREENAVRRTKVTTIPEIGTPGGSAKSAVILWAREAYCCIRTRQRRWIHLLRGRDSCGDFAG